MNGYKVTTSVETFIFESMKQAGDFIETVTNDFLQSGLAVQSGNYRHEAKIGRVGVVKFIEYDGFVIGDIIEVITIKKVKLQ